MIHSFECSCLDSVSFFVTFACTEERVSRAFYLVSVRFGHFITVNSCVVRSSG